MRQRKRINENWKFQLGEEGREIYADFDDSSWRELNLPHDWSVEAQAKPENPAGAGGGFFPGGLGWYRKEIDIPKDLGWDRLLIEFDGVYMNSEVFCNGRLCGVRPYGYSSFCYDITPYVQAGEKATLAVRVDNARQPNSRWYSGSGIYRHVYLTQAEPLRVDHWGTYITTPEVTESSATVVCETRLINSHGEEQEAQVEIALLDKDGKVVAEKSRGDLHVKAGDKSSCQLQLDVPNPKLWSPDEPYLYTLQTTVTQNEEVIDVTETKCGIRSLRFDANEGFFLNETSLKMMGVNEHHDAGCLGAAVPDDVVRHRFQILKEMGCNAIRVAHNPASPTFLDLCDEMGFLVVEDAFDEWRDGKTPFGYQLHWDKWWEQDLVDMIHRDRNHPCIVMWSVGNEIKEVRSGNPVGLPIMEALLEVCHREDPTRPMTCGCCDTRKTLAAGYGPLMDVVGYNGGGGSCFDYEKDHLKYPEMIIFASEVPHSLETRGVYRTRTWYRDLKRNPNLEKIDVPHFTEEEVFTDFDEHYQSSYDNAQVRISAIDSWRYTKNLPFMLGEFRWTGFDYIGECYGWPAKSWNFGVIDLCGFPKDAYYFYQSQWTSEPMVHPLPHWSWPGLEGKTIPVMVYSNCEEVELFLNGKSLGSQKMGDEMVLRWDVEYKPGSLKAIGRNGGNEVASKEHLTAGNAELIQLTSRVDHLRADGTGVAHVEARVVDAAGNLVHSADQELSWSISGAGEILGLENGDPIDTTHYRSPSRKVFHGMSAALVQSTAESGSIEVTAEATGLKSGKIRIQVS
jgi:beta-galactosidase